MVKNWLKGAWNSGPVLGLLLAGALTLSAAGSTSRAAEPAPALPQGAQAAKNVARKAAAAPKGGQSAPAKEGPSATAPAPHKWGPVEAGHRDPFNIPKPVKGGAGEPGVGMDQASGMLPKGKRGLVISQLTLEGIVNQKASNSNIAVVKSPVSRAAFFLRENDEVYNGVVSKITPDSIYFTENARDLTGQMISRQVVKKLGSGPGEK